MKQIELAMHDPLPAYMELDIVDTADGKKRKRGSITVEYSDYDVKPLLEQGMDIDAATDYYKDRIYNTVRRYLLCDFECKNDMEDVLRTIRGNISKYF